MGALYRYIDPHEIDAIALSHLHADHCLDLCGYYVAARYSPNAPWPRRPVYAPASAAARLARAYEVTGTNSEVSESGASLAEQFDWHTWQPSQQIGPFLVRAVRVAHPVEAYGIRVEEEAPGGGAMVYSGDTGPSEDLVHFARTVSTCCWWSRLSSTVPTILPACISPVLRLPLSDRRRASGPWS